MPRWFQVGQKLGLDTVRPQEKIDIDGNLQATQLKVTDALVVKKDGEVGNQEDPQFSFTIANAGIDEPELKTTYSDDDEGPIKVAGLESTGTYATVRRTRGSHFEGFSPDGVSDPTFRINTYPEGKCVLEMGAGGTKSAVAGATRTTNVVTVTTAWPHGFGDGQTVNLASAMTMSAGIAVPADDYTATYVDSTHFTIPHTGTNGTSTNIGYWSAGVDVAVTREAYNHLGLSVGGNRKFSIYADSMTTEDAIRFATAGSLETSKITATTTTPYALGVEWGVLVDATAGAKVVNLPAAAGCKGRQYFIKKTDAGVNTVTIEGNAAETLDGAANVALTAQWDNLLIVSDGTNWMVISSVVT